MRPSRILALLEREFLASAEGAHTPVFEWTESEPVRLHALLYFTGAAGEFSERAPVYRVMWLVIGNAPVPFGERVQLNEVWS